MSLFNRPLLLVGLFRMRCPNCRKGRVFVQKQVLPLNKCLAMYDHCPRCGQKYKHESNNGAGINYALTIIIFFLNLLWYWPIFGLSYLDNSIFYFLATSIVVVVLLQPWLMRLSRMFYLYMFIPYGSGPNPNPDARSPIPNS